MNEIMNYGDFNKNTVYDDKWKFDEFIASGGSADRGSLWEQDSDCKTEISSHNAQAPLPTTARRRRISLRRTSRRCGRRRSDLPAPLNAALWTIFRVASLNWGSEQSFITNPGPWSQRSGRWWGPSTGTPWRRPARAWGPESRLLLLLTAVYK